MGTNYIYPQFFAHKLLTKQLLPYFMLSTTKCKVKLYEYRYKLQKSSKLKFLHCPKCNQTRKEDWEKETDLTKAVKKGSDNSCCSFKLCCLSCDQTQLDLSRTETQKKPSLDDPITNPTRSYLTYISKIFLSQTNRSNPAWSKLEMTHPIATSIHLHEW